MSTVSKILVVVILVLVAGSTFLQVALFAQKANWRKVYEAEKQAHQADVGELEDKVTTKNDSISNLEQELQSVKAENSNLADQVEQLNTTLAEAQRKVEQAEQMKAEKEDQLTQLNEKVTSMMERIEQLQEKMRRDSQELLEVKREYERLVNTVTALRDRNNSLMMTLNNTRRQLEEYTRSNEELTLALRKYRTISEQPIEVTKPKETIRAQVLAANNEAAVIFLSVGKDDKVELGMEFIIHRGSTYVCKARVESVYPDSCVARIIEKSLNEPGAKVEVGDNAFTD
ncbi:MAG: hypothetical protein U5N86_04890 [Planctomycetota bacterium]|nr:hypothetical protein [Planctomycetota bacterium]